MSDAVDVRVLHRREHALRGVFVEGRVQRRDDPVPPRKRFVVDIDRAVGADVHLDALEETEAAELPVQSFNLTVLRLEPPLAQVVRVIGDREVGVASALRFGRQPNISVMGVAYVQFLKAGTAAEHVGRAIGFPRPPC